MLRLSFYVTILLTITAIGLYLLYQLGSTKLQTSLNIMQYTVQLSNAAKLILKYNRSIHHQKQQHYTTSCHTSGKLTHDQEWLTAPKIMPEKTINRKCCHDMNNIHSEINQSENF